VDAALEHTHDEREIFADELAIWDCGGVDHLKG
jgi:hypothetical protein